MLVVGLPHHNIRENIMSGSAGMSKHRQQMLQADNARDYVWRNEISSKKTLSNVCVTAEMLIPGGLLAVKPWVVAECLKDLYRRICKRKLGKGKGINQVGPARGFPKSLKVAICQVCHDRSPGHSDTRVVCTRAILA